MFESPFLCISEKDDNPLIELFMEHIRLKYINSVYILIFMYHIFNLLRNNFIHCINKRLIKHKKSLDFKIDGMYFLEKNTIQGFKANLIINSPKVMKKIITFELVELKNE